MSSRFSAAPSSSSREGTSARATGPTLRQHPGTGTSGLPDPDALPEFYAGVPIKRLMAWVVDIVLIFVICLLVLPFTAFTGLFFFPFLMLVTGFLYRWATIASGSATWGMRLFAIELREADGLRLSGGTAFAHTLGYSVSLAIAPLQLISVGLMVLTPRRQGLTDLVLGTAAINRPQD